MPVVLPPLRERDGDIRLLIEYYIDRFNREFRKKVRGLNSDALALLEHYRWPGNIRELRNAIERAMLLVDREWLTPQDFPSLIRQSSSAWLFRLPPEGVSLEDVERQLVVQALERSSWNQTHAGALLRINRDQVRYRIEKFGLRPPHATHDRTSAVRERVPA
jgi:DNA-binding NtrC family response regulator